MSFGFSIQNEPNHSTLQAGTLETAAAEHQCLDVVNNAHDSVNETEPSATMLAPSNDWQPSDPCSSSQSSRPMDEYVPISMLQAPLDVCISVHSCDTSCSSSQSSQSYTLDTTATTAAINDPAKWTVTENLREYWALHGPTRCYNNDGRTPLYIASREGHHDVVQSLLGAGAEVNIARSDHFGFLEDVLHIPHTTCQTNATPLYIASREGHHDVVQSLLGAGAEVNIARSDVSDVT
ncbi:hypothetical protein EMCRGX_G005671 [Ephydatia muelleri]